TAPRGRGVVRLLLRDGDGYGLPRLAHATGLRQGRGGGARGQRAEVHGRRPGRRGRITRATDRLRHTARGAAETGALARGRCRLSGAAPPPEPHAGGARAITTMTGTAACSARIRRRTSTPLIPGLMRSRRTRPSRRRQPRYGAPCAPTPQRVHLWRRATAQPYV